MLTAGQLELNNYVNTEAKYTKFAYSSRFGFTLERGRFGLKHAACDSMLLLADGDDYFRGRRECEEVRVDENYIFSRWSPWRDVQIATADPVRGVAPAPAPYQQHAHSANRRGRLCGDENRPPVRERGCYLLAENGSSVIVDLSPIIQRQPDSIVTPPNSSIMFAECASIPLLKADLPQGKAGSVAPSRLAEDSLLRRRHS